MSAKNSCDMISSTANNMSGIANLFETLNPFKNSNQVRNELKNNINVELSDKEVQDIQNSCKNASNIDQINVLSSKSECINMASQICAVGDDPIKRGQCAREILGNENIKQMNKAKLEANCMIDNAINIISKKDASVNNISAVLALQNAKGPLTGNKVNNSVCNNLNTTISTDKFVKSYMECINETSSKQKNLIDSCGNRKINQENFYESMAKCLAKNNVVSNTENIVKTINDTSIKSDQSSSFLGIDFGIDLKYIVIILVIVLAICCVCSIISGGLIYYMSTKN